jgi:uncharacterized cupredoxin-like copper-binding protein
MNRTQALVAAALVSIAGASMAHGDDDHSKRAGAPVKMEQKEWGIAADARAAERTIQVSMSDSMRFTPSRIEVKQGETVRFVVKNWGTVMHEMVLGTKKELDEHAEMMAKFPNMEHDEPYMTHVGPGKTGEIVWAFNRPGTFDFACLIAGHYQAGMVGKIRVSVSEEKAVGDGSHRD